MQPAKLILTIISFCMLAACTTTGGVLNSLGNAPGSGSSGRNAASGVLLQSIVEPRLARRLDRKSRQSAFEAEQNALENGETGQVTRWEGNATTTGEVVPEQTYQVGSQNCRRYSHTITIGSETFPNTGTACRETNGQWAPLT